MMRFNWLIPAALAVTVGILATGINLVWQRTADAVPPDNKNDVQKAVKTSDNSKDVQKRAQPGNNQEQPKPREAKIIAGSRARQWREKLDQPITIEFEPNTPLREALSHLAERYKMTVLVDTDAFKVDQNQPDVENQPVRLPKLADVRLLTALRAIFQQVGADFYTKDGVLIVVPLTCIETGRVFKHPVDVTFSKRPLADALSELSDLSGLSVILDPRGQADGTLAVTADFRNVPVQDAVRVLADMAGMKSVAMDNLIYVTSVANADNLELDAARKRGAAPAKWEEEKPKEKK